MTTKTESELTNHARDDLFTLLAQNNTLSQDHKAALSDVLSTYSQLALMGDEGRLVRAFPLSMGLGKTQSVASWCHAVSELKHDGISILVCGEQLDDLDRLRADMIRRGVCESKIGFVHSNKKHDKLTPCSTEAPDQYQFLLVSHQMVRCRADIECLNTYQGHERSLCVWDESLVRNDGGYITAIDVERTLEASRVDVSGYFSAVPFEHDQSDLKRALGYVHKGLERVKAEHEQQTHYGREPQIIEGIPQLDAAIRARYKQAIAQSISRVEDRRIINKFLELCQSDLRVNRIAGAGKSGQGVISFVPKVPRSLKRLVILDASCMVRELSRMDPDIDIVERWANVKTFENVQVTQYPQFNGGWNSLNRLRKNSTAITHIVNLIREIPAGESILLCSRKGKGNKPGPLDKVREALIDAGISLDDPPTQPVWDEDKGRMCWTGKRINFIHWGQHKATSKYAHCKHVVALGVLRRDQLELSSAMAAQAEDVMDPRVSCHKAVRRVVVSEQFYCLQQLIGRGPARESIGGVAKESQVYVYDQENFGELIQEGLPGIRWTVAEKEKKVRVGTKASKLAELMNTHLNGLPAHTQVVPLKSLKAALDMDFSQKTFQNARDIVVARLPQWELQQRSLVRT